MKRIALTIFLLLSSLCSFATGRQYVYTQIAQKEGLTSTVNSIYKEKNGDVWIGTPNGLYSFNGYTLTNHSGKLFKSRRIFNVSEGADGSLWVLTDKHILKKDMGSDAFQRVSQDIEPYFSLLHDGEMTWIGGKGKIYRYIAGELEVFCTTPESFDCRILVKINDTTLLCGSHNGKWLTNIDDKTVSDSPFGTINEVSAMLVDSKGRIWIAYYNNGIEVYDKNGTTIQKFRNDNSSLSNDIVLCLSERGSMILAGTDGGGINIIDPEDGSIRVLSHVSGDRSSFPAHSIKSIFTDQYGNIWAGSIRDGLISITLSEISSYSDTFLGLTNGLSNPSVLCLHQDKSSGYIWIGTDGEGINRFDPETATFTHFKSTFKTKAVSIADFSDRELAISVYGDHVYLFDKATGRTRPMVLDNDNIIYQLKHSGRSINLYNETDGDLLLFANAVYRYDRTTGRCRQIAIDDELNYSYNFFILGRSSEGVWMHNNFNVFLLEDDSERLILKGSHPHNAIRSGHLASNGIIWLATEEGLCRFNTADNKFSHIETTLFSEATSVICDNRARVWIGTEKGLSAYLSESGSFALFGKSDGVESNEYLPKPRLLASNGDIYFGGVQGLLHIRGDYTFETTEIPDLRLNKVIVDGEVHKLEHTDRLDVPRHGKSIDISIEVKERDMFRHRVFRFSVSDQVYETSLPELSIQRMPEPGEHDIKVACTRRNGEWTEPVTIMTLNVPQPWYATWWFIGGCLVFIIGIYILTIFTINKRKSNQLRLAMKEQEQKVYEDKVAMLINISHELRTPLTLIMAPLKRLLKSLEPEDDNFSVLSRIYRQSRRMHNLLDMVLDLRKMEVNGNHMKITKTDFNAWIAESIEDIVNEEKAEGIEIVYDFDNLIGLAEFDKQKCDIVLMNILINAIKHSSFGDTITIKTELVDGFIRTSISDQGPGLGADVDQTKMFTRFYQSKNEQYGSGIGLSYSKILVEMHGGRIGVYNNTDIGATFWWEIPVTTASEGSQENRAYLNELLGHSSEADISTPAEDTFSTAGMRLMLVDDNQDLLDFLREALCESFAEIITATGGKEALRQITTGKLPDIIVSDVNMPDGDGFWLCSELKGNDRYSHIPFVLLTARGEDQSQSESYRLGADSFLAKPFEIDTLMELIRNLLRRKAEIRKKYLDNQDIADAEYGSEEERFILQLNRIIDENMSNPALDQQLICRELGVSRALLYNRMKAITGAGAKEYITKIRIEKAKALIENTSMTIAEISDMTGFASQSYFSTAFKNYTGMTPSQYKQNVKTLKS